MNDWKELEIGNIPSDFYVNERYEVERKIGTVYLSIIKGDPKSKVIYGLEQGQKYRYRLKALESIRITEDIALDLCTYICTAKNKSADFYHTEDLENHYGRKVEIIE